MYSSVAQSNPVWPSVSQSSPRSVSPAILHLSGSYCPCTPHLLWPDHPPTFTAAGQYFLDPKNNIWSSSFQFAIQRKFHLTFVAQLLSGEQGEALICRDFNWSPKGRAPNPTTTKGHPCHSMRRKTQQHYLSQRRPVLKRFLIETWHKFSFTSLSFIRFTELIGTITLLRKLQLSGSRPDP